MIPLVIRHHFSFTRAKFSERIAPDVFNHIQTKRSVRLGQNIVQEPFLASRDDEGIIACSLHYLERHVVKNWEHGFLAETAFVHIAELGDYSHNDAQQNEN